MENLKTPIPYNEINELLTLIVKFNQQIKSELTTTGNPNSFGVSQAIYWRDKYLAEINEILKEYNLVLTSLL
jgi:hypothetical protein